MRCPNCGNENPDDYTFCDECGAKLQPQDEATDAGVAAGTEAAPSTATYAPAAAASGAANVPSGPLADDSSGSMSGGLAGATATCPNCGAPVVPGEAYCSECGAELPANLAGVGAGAEAADEDASMQPYTPSAASAPAESAPQEVPVTEETVEAPVAPAAEAAPAAMPGVEPIDESAGAAAMPGPAPVPATPAVSAPAIEHVEWANDALEQLDTAQQAMARGDFIGYGQAMTALKSFLENIAQGGGSTATSAAASAGAGAAPASIAYAPAAEAAPVAPVQPVEAPAAPAAESTMAETPAAAAVPGGQRAGLARLVVISSGAELPLPQQEEITVGREDPSSGIFPDIDLTPYGGEDGGVSRRHARLLHVGGDYFVEDLQSTNYTKVDGQRLPARVREKLEDGARLDFGRVAVIFRRS